MKQARPTFPVLILASALAAAAPSRALETDRMYGEAGFKFLKLPLAPRIVSLAGAGSALADDVGALDLNPAAGAADSGHLVLGKGYPFAQFQSSSSHIAWAIPLDGGYRILLNARYLGFDDIPGWSEQDDTTSAYGAHSLKAQAGLAGRWGKLQWGATLNFAGNGIASANYATAMVNVGARYPLLPGLMAGASVVNADFWDSRAKDENNRDPFPPTAAQAGLAYTHALGADWQAALAVDARTRNDEEMAWPMGLEVAWKKMLFARAGFPFGEQEPGFAAGLGLRWSLFQFQYAFQSHATLSPGIFWSLDLAL
jgi:hypothetical protein